MKPVSPGSGPFRRAERVLAQSVDGSVVLLHLDDGRYFALDDVGARFWELLDGRAGLSEIATLIASEYAVARDRVEEDLVELVNDLADERLVERNP